LSEKLVAFKLPHVDFNDVISLIKAANLDVHSKQLERIVNKHGTEELKGELFRRLRRRDGP